MLTNAGSPQSGPADSRFSAPLVPGRRDELGERWTTTWAADGSSVDVLELRGEFSRMPGAERALRERITRLATFKHPAFAEIRDLYHHGANLRLVSGRITGQRLSEVQELPRAKRVAFVARALQQSTSALTALEAVGPGVTHAALTGDRIVVTADGTTRIADHVIGSALQQLALWPEELFLEFGLLAPADHDGQAAFGAQTTVIQLGAAGLSALLGRSISLDDLDHGVETLLDEFEASASTSPLVVPMRNWLERTLQVDQPEFTSAADAELGLKQALADAGPAAATEIEAVSFPAPPAPRLVTRTDEDVRANERLAATPPLAPSLNPTTASPAPAPDSSSLPAATFPGPVTAAPAVKPMPWAPPVLATRAAIPEPIVPAPAPIPVTLPPPVPDATTGRGPLGPYLAWAAVALAVVAIAEAGVIAWLMTKSAPAPLSAAVTIESTQPGTTVMVDGRPAGAAPLKLQVTQNTHAIRVSPAADVAPPPVTAAVTPARPETDQTAALERAAARQRSGGVTFAAPIPLNVLEGDRVLGSTADGPIVASAGQHTLDLVNAALGYRVRQVVTIRPGTIARISITPPMGRISINAQPWAQVLIDDTAVGETPLANLPATIGEHQVTFRHPQFGERRERVIVRADTPARISTTFQR
jgi:hypothetical protein